MPTRAIAPNTSFAPSTLLHFAELINGKLEIRNGPSRVVESELPLVEVWRCELHANKCELSLRQSCRSWRSGGVSCGASPACGGGVGGIWEGELGGMRSRSMHARGDEILGREARDALLGAQETRVSGSRSAGGSSVSSSCLYLLMDLRDKPPSAGGVGRVLDDVAWTVVTGVGWRAQQREREHVPVLLWYRYRPLRAVRRAA